MEDVSGETTIGSGQGQFIARGFICAVAARLMRYDLANERLKMATLKLMLNEFPWEEQYRVANADAVLTPALVLYPEIIASNIAQTISLLNGDASRWRVHVKTAKLAYTMRMLLERGVVNFKCATTLELLMACESGARDVLVAYPMVGANARRVLEIRDLFPKVRISVLVENTEQITQ